MDDFSSSEATHQQWLRLFVTPNYACNYLPDQQARSQVVAPDSAGGSGVYGQLLEKGFRRSGQVVYRPWCDQCQACVPIRVPVKNFRPNRSQRRCWQRNSGLQVALRPLVFDAEHYALYRAYQHARHTGGSMDNDSEQEYRDFILGTGVDSALVEFRADGALKMVALVDFVPQALSAVYTFYADEPAASFGTYGVLWQIAHAQRLGLSHVYLGYWIGASDKMNYKNRFQPCEILRGGRWQVFTDR
ncbi:MAG: arginyltransferase [Brachymonas sp.]|nr:arginyltransferase [Brachymonas sp.]